MLKLLKLKDLFLVLACLSLASCGYLRDDPIENIEHYDSSGISSCEAKPGELAYILERNIEGQIRCLQENLEVFNKYVRRESQTYITERELGGFIQRFFKGHGQIVLKSLGLIFEFNGFLLNDHRERISSANIRPLFHLLVATNREAVVINEVLRKMERGEGSVNGLSEELEASLKRIQSHFMPIVRQRMATAGGMKRVNIKDFIKRVHQQFSTYFNKIDGETIDVLLGFKKLFLGGRKDEMTSNELLVFIEKAPELVVMAFKLYYANQKRVGSKETLHKFYQRSLRELKLLFHGHVDSEVFFHQDEVLHMVDRLWNGSERKDFYKKITLETKTRLIDGRGAESKVYTFKNIRTILTLADGLLEALRFSYEIEPLWKDIDGIREEERGLRRTQFVERSALLGIELKKIVKELNLFSPYMELGAYIDFLKENADELNWNEAWLSPLKIMKKVLLGGDEDYSNFVELQRLFDKSALMAELFFDIYTLNSRKEHKTYKTLIYAARTMKKLVYSDDLYRVLFDSKELAVLGSNFLKNTDLTSFTPTLDKIKKGLLGGEPESYTVQAFLKLIDIAEEFSTYVWFMNTTYDFYQKEMESSEEIDYLPTFPLEDYEFLPVSTIESLRKEFFNIAKNYRFYRDDKGYQYYGSSFKRDKNGFVEIASMKWGFSKLAKIFGHEDKKTGVFVWNLDEVNSMLEAFKPVLVYYGLWSNYPEYFARNTLLLADLFQYQANGDLNMSPTEAAEFGAMSLQTVDIGDGVRKHLEKWCEQIPLRGDFGYRVDCFRPFFFKILLDEMGLSEYFVKLDKYIKESSEDEVILFLKSIEGFARDYPDHIPISRREIILIIGAIINIESTYIRYDENNNNILDPKELNKGFDVYKNAVIEMANLKGKRVKYAKTIYFYMVEKMAIPSKWAVLFRYYTRWLLHKFDKVAAKRLNIGVLLDYMVNNNNNDEKAYDIFEEKIEFEPDYDMP